MPTYNRACYILETIESIREQTHTNWELIIVDDGSEDNTEELVAQLKDKRIQFYKAGRIGIVGKLKNIGLNKASGNFIAFIDSDDLWATTKLEKQVAALQQYPQAGFCVTGGYNFKNLHEPTEYFYNQREGIKYGNVFISFFESQLAGFTQALMLRRTCIDVAGYFKEAQSYTMNDIEFIAGLSYHFKAVILYEPLIYRRLHNANYITSNWLKSYYEGIEIIEDYKRKKLLPTRVAQNSLFKLYINFGEDCLSHNEYVKAINNFFKAWKNKPFSVVPLKKIIKATLYYFKKSGNRCLLAI